MISKAIKKIVGSRNDRLLKQYGKVVKQINQLEADIAALSDEALQAKTPALKQRLEEGASLNDILPEAFAVCREAAKRVMGMRHFDVQLIGGMVLHHGKVAEMRTGEGKTLTATLAVYLNALTGKGVHLVTVNDYLAERDANWMRPLYSFLGLTVGINLASMDASAKQQAYQADVTYSTNNECGFDYLRDNMAYAQGQKVQRELNFCIVDEVDSILIDEARTPLIISGQVEQSAEIYGKINQLVPKLKQQMEEEDPTGEKEIAEADKGDFYVDEKHKTAQLTEQGHEKVEHLMQEAGLLAEGSTGLYDVKNLTLLHYLNACIRAHYLFHKDVDYIVRNGEVIIVDEHTGRLMDGRRWSDGLHQAVEAKEGVNIQLENQTLATITFQNYFRLFNKLAGMTGTADTEAFELNKIYGLEVVVVPTNKPTQRKDMADKIFLTAAKKYETVIGAIKEAVERGQPVLVGTASIESSELVSKLLNKEKIKHQVLNAKQHEKEAKIIAEAGRPGAVTIATNMAGRGTDIVLGGNLEVEMEALGDANEQQIAELKQDWQQRHQQVLDAGGLFVIATERNESRRVDNQLRGRSGRQGDPGQSSFYLSMEDSLLRIFAAERMTNLMRRLGVTEDDVIEHKWITNAIEKAQRRVEGMNFDIRKQLLEYDDVANDQRKIVYAQRNELLTADSIEAWVEKIRDEAVKDLVATYIPPESVEDQWDIPGLQNRLKEEFALELPVQQWLDDDANVHEAEVVERIDAALAENYANKVATYGLETMQQLEKNLLLQVLDNHWREHLAAMDHLRQGIHLQGYAQKNPAQEYKRVSFEMFSDMWRELKLQYVSMLARVELQSESSTPPKPATVNMSYQHNSLAGDAAADEDKKVGRNEPCPCGSGKKYKQCHGKLS